MGRIAKDPNPLTPDGLTPREIRRRLGLNQEEFWTRIGVTQSGGSRYETGRDMPRPVRELFRLVYVEGVDLSRVGREDLQVIDYLRRKHADLYQRLLAAVRANEETDAKGLGALAR